MIFVGKSNSAHLQLSVTSCCSQVKTEVLNLVCLIWPLAATVAVFWTFLLLCAQVTLLLLLLSRFSCVQLWDPIDGSPPGSPIPGILQARTLEWVAISFSNAWKWKVKSESEVAQSCLTLSDPMDYSPPGSSIHGIFQARVLEWGAIAGHTSYLQTPQTGSSSCYLRAFVLEAFPPGVLFHSFITWLTSCSSGLNSENYFFRE